jgi:hypothetical protein
MTGARVLDAAAQSLEKWLDGRSYCEVGSGKWEVGVVRIA